MMTIDARGLSCPQPLVMLKKALKTENELLIIEDNKYAATNCENFAKKRAYAVEAEKDGEDYKLSLKVKNE
jgi:TusA-related sulfurtransferase